VRRGELWAYAPQIVPRQRTVVLVSSDSINASPRPWLIAAEMLADDPGDILAVPIPGHGWVHAGNLTRVYRGWLTECIGQVPAETAARLDTALRAAVDL
jgi:mRNA interferase MazF